MRLDNSHFQPPTRSAPSATSARAGTGGRQKVQVPLMQAAKSMPSRKIKSDTKGCPSNCFSPGVQLTPVVPSPGSIKTSEELQQNVCADFQQLPLTTLCEMAREAEDRKQRLAAFSVILTQLQIKRSLETGLVANANLPIQDLVSTSLEGLQDVPQVSAAALSVLAVILPAFPSSCTQYLDRLFLRLLSLNSSGTAADQSRRLSWTRMTICITCITDMAHLS
jgi:hypothetical protein